MAKEKAPEDVMAEAVARDTIKHIHSLNTIGTLLRAMNTTRQRELKKKIIYIVKKHLKEFPREAPEE